MEESVQEALHEHEQMVSDGKIGSFTVLLRNKNKLLIQPTGSRAVREVILTPDLHNTLQIFFYGIDSIGFGTFDYTTLKSLLNAHSTLERMKSRAENQK